MVVGTLSPFMGLPPIMACEMYLHNNHPRKQLTFNVLMDCLNHYSPGDAQTG